MKRAKDGVNTLLEMASAVLVVAGGVTFSGAFGETKYYLLLPSLVCIFAAFLINRLLEGEQNGR